MNAPIETPHRNYYEDTTQFEIAQNNSLLAISNQDEEAYNYWQRVENRGSN